MMLIVMTTESIQQHDNNNDDDPIDGANFRMTILMTMRATGNW